MENAKLRQGEKILGKAEIMFDKDLSFILIGLSIICMVVLISMKLFSIAILFLCIGLIPYLCSIAKVKKTELYYTNKRVCGKSGIFSQKMLDTPLEKINTIYIKKSILGYYNIVIASSSGNHTFSNINNAEQLKEGILEEIERYNQEKVTKQSAELVKAIQNQKQ